MIFETGHGEIARPCFKDCQPSTRSQKLFFRSSGIQFKRDKKKKAPFLATTRCLHWLKRRPRSSLCHLSQNFWSLRRTQDGGKKREGGAEWMQLISLTLMWRNKDEISGVKLIPDELSLTAEAQMRAYWSRLHGDSAVCVEAAANRSRRRPCPLPSSFSDKIVIIRDLTLQLFPPLTSVHNNRSAELRQVLRSLKVFLEVLGISQT